MANSLDAIGSGLGRLESDTPVTVGATVTEKVFVTVAVTTGMPAGSMVAQENNIAVPTPAAHVKNAVHTETVWISKLDRKAEKAPESFSEPKHFTAYS